MSTSSDLRALCDVLLSSSPSGRPLVVGLAGSVGVGKTTLAQRLRAELAQGGASCTVVGTDGFLLPNRVLDERGLLLRKGYPESYDHAEIGRFFDALHAGASSVETPQYSHRTFDLDGSTRHDIGDVVVVEGINTLQAPAVDRLDVRVYLDAPEPVVRAWFVTRMLGFIDAARDDPSSFYAQFVSYDEAARRTFATGVWEHINLPNLLEHIEPSRVRADWTVTVDADHAIVEVRSARGRSDDGRV